VVYLVGRKTINTSYFFYFLTNLSYKPKVRESLNTTINRFGQSETEYIIEIIDMDKRIAFLKPRLLNLLLTLLILCLPILREQYNQGQYVTWHRSIVVIFNNLQQNLRQPELLLITTLFVFIIYFLVSLALVGLSKFKLPMLKRYR